MGFKPCTAGWPPSPSARTGVQPGVLRRKGRRTMESLPRLPQSLQTPGRSARALGCSINRWEHLGLSMELVRRCHSWTKHVADTGYSYAVRTPFGGMHLLLQAQDVVNALARLSQSAKLKDLPLTDTFQQGLLFSFNGIDAPVPMWVGSSQNVEEKARIECLEGQPWEEPNRVGMTGCHDLTQRPGTSTWPDSMPASGHRIP